MNSVLSINVNDTYMWLGMIFFSGILGLGLSWLAVPPYKPDTTLRVED